MIGAHGQPELLAQITPNGTSPVELLAARDIRVEVTLILATNTGVGAVIARIFHDDDGSTRDDTTEIIRKSIAVNSSEVLFQAQHPGSGIPVKKAGTLGAQISVADDVTLSLYGVTENIAVRGARQNG